MFALDIEHFQCAPGALTHLVLGMYPDITSTVAVLCRSRSQPRVRAPLCPRSPHPDIFAERAITSWLYHSGADGGDILSGYVMLTGGTISLGLQQHGRATLSRAMVKS